MSILQVYGEDADAVGGVGSFSVTTTAGRFRPTYSRSAMLIANIGSGFVLNEGWHLAFPAPLSSLWITGRVYQVNNGVSSAGGALMTWYSGGGLVPRLALRPLDPIGGFSVSTVPMQLVKFNSVGAVTVVFTSSTVLPRDSLRKLDFAIDYSAAGRFRAFLDGVPIIDYTGDLTTDGNTMLDAVRLGYLMWSGGGAGSNSAAWSEIILADEDTRDMALATLTPSAAGNAQTWTGVVGNINETTLNDATLLTTAAANQLAQFTVVPASVISGTVSLRGLFVNARVARGSSGPQNMQAVVRTGAADFTSPNLAVGGALNRASYQWAVNPQTGLAWTAADILAAGFNIGLKSIA